jgi:alpha-beta hydrolase superfamily lysophospholipase
MELIILPGNDKSNVEWMESVEQSFSGAYKDRYKQRYSHWESDKKLIDFDDELEKLVEHISKSKENYVIFAKSAGALLVLYGIYKEKIKPEKCVFVGLPVNWAAKNNFPLDKWLEKYNVPTIILQNSQDPVTSFAELESFFEKINKSNIERIEIPGIDHKYNKFELISEKATKFLTQEELEEVKTEKHESEWRIR